MKLRRNLVAVLIVLSVLCAACTPSQIRRAIKASRDFRITVGAFQDSEIAAHHRGLVPDDLHIKIQAGIEKVAVLGPKLNARLAANDKAGAQAVVEEAYGIADDVLTSGVLPIKDEQTKATLEVALQSLKTLITTVQALLA